MKAINPSYILHQKSVEDIWAVSSHYLVAGEIVMALER